MEEGADRDAVDPFKDGRRLAADMVQVVKCIFE
jgi:hypothetical protein